MKALPFVVFGAACFLGLWGCGGGSSGTGQGTLNTMPVWPQPGGGQPTSQLPAAAQTVRVLFDSDGPPPLHCCLALDPRSVPIDATTGLRLLLLDTPAGPATFSLAAFPGSSAPAPGGPIDICPTNPPGIGQPCDTTRPDTPSFQSPPQAVTIVPGGSQPVDVGLTALPFLLNLQPAPNDSVTSPVAISFTAADAVTGVDDTSIAVEASFRTLSKRVPVTLSPCDDKTDTPCSQDGVLQVTGFRVVGTPPFLPAGAASLHITGRNLASPPGTLDFTYDFTVVDQSGGTPGPASATTLNASSGGSGSGSNGTPTSERHEPAISTGAALSPSRQSTWTATTTPLAIRRPAGTPTATCTPLVRLPEGPS